MNILRRRDAAFTREQITGPSMTPMVDVTLVILIFFMATAAVAGREWLFPVMPNTDAAEHTEPISGSSGIPAPIIELRIIETANGPRVSGAGLRSIPADQLAGAIVGVVEGIDTSGLSFVLVPDDDVPYAAVVAARAQLGIAGFESIGVR